MKIGLFGIGLDTYWGQFQGLLQRLAGYQQQIACMLEESGAEVVNGGMVDNPSKAALAASLFNEEKVELVFVYVSTYALSSTVLPVAQRVKVPFIILNLQPSAAIDYQKINSMGDRGAMTGEWLAHCQACSVPELACVFNRAGIRYDILTGYMQEARVREEMTEWVAAVKAAQGMKDNRMGILGHYYGGMLDVYTDTTLQSTTFGTHIEQLEMCELHALCNEVSESEVEAKLEEFQQTFLVDDACERAELERAARTSVALDKLVEKHRLGSMAYYYEGAPGNE